MEQIALRVCMEKDEDINVLNGYLKNGYHIILQSDVSRRTVYQDDDDKAALYYSIIIYILEK